MLLLNKWTDCCLIVTKIHGAQAALEKGRLLSGSGDGGPYRIIAILLCPCFHLHPSLTLE